MGQAVEVTMGGTTYSVAAILVVAALLILAIAVAVGGVIAYRRKREVTMEKNELSQTFLESMARRVVAWGCTTVGFLGLILALNAGYSNEYVSAGACLAASALAFGVYAYAFLRK